jgi:hypothetical protein
VIIPKINKGNQGHMIIASMSSPIRQLPQVAYDDVVAGSHQLEELEGGPVNSIQFIAAYMLQLKPQN